MEEHHHNHNLVRLRLTALSDRLLFLRKLKTITSVRKAEQLEVRKQLGEMGIKGTAFAAFPTPPGALLNNTAQ